eukprot:2828826-Amphidinium_carterae.1
MVTGCTLQWSHTSVEEKISALSEHHGVAIRAQQYLMNSELTNYSEFVDKHDKFQGWLGRKDSEAPFAVPGDSWNRDLLVAAPLLDARDVRDR